MNTAFKRGSKHKSKTTQKVVTVKEMFTRKDPCTNKVSSSENQNESLVEVFKSYGVKGRTLSASQSTRSTDTGSQSTKSVGISQGTTDEPFEGLFSDFKNKTENVAPENAKSDDSFDELFTDFKTNTVRRVEIPLPEASVGEDKDFSEILRENLSPCCPVCFKKNNFEDEGLYINHLKSCAYKSKVSIEQLKKALELQLKQASERLALGLPLAPKKNPSKKPYQRKGPMDVNLELGIALSESLRQSEIMNKIQEKETLIEAGIEPETLTQYKNLEDFGFATNKPAEPTNFRANKRNKNTRSTVLFNRTQEERERIITEKVAMILIDDDSQSTPPDASEISKTCTVKSNYLKRFKDEGTSLWKMSQQTEEHTDDSYYVKSLSNLISPCKVAVGSKLRHLSQIPGRAPSPKPSTSKDFGVCASPPPFRNAPVAQKLEKKFTKKIPPSTTDSRFCQDWRYMLNKDILSDLTIYAKNEVPIFAHKLVFYARCRSILPETIEETENDKKREILMWMEYSYEAVIALLEYIYTGVLPALTTLADVDKTDLRALSHRYEFKHVVDAIDNLEEPQMFPTDEEKSASREKITSFNPVPSFFQNDPTCYKQDEEVKLFSSDQVNDQKANNGEKNLQMMLQALQTQNLRSCSPEIFDDDSELEDSCEKKNSPETENINRSSDQSMIEEILWKLCSPVHSPRKPSDGIEDEGNRSPLTQCLESTRELDCNKKNLEKRKSFSPPEKNKFKKCRFVDDVDSPSKNPLKNDRQIPQKLPLSQVLSISDTENEETTYNIAANCETPISNYNDSSFCINKSGSKDSASSIPETEKTDHMDSYHPYISPVWEGFDDFHNISYNMDHSPVSNLVPLDTPVRALASTSGISKSPATKTTGDSLFDSFSIDEDYLNKIETNVKGFASQKPIRSSTPDSVRKFQRRSKSENCITPVNKNLVNNVTPLADYSSMKGDDLKKELEKYGIKPGLSRNKAKMMLRYIYEQLHPYEDETKDIASKKINNQPKSRKDAENLSSHNTDSYDSSGSETSGISLLEETYVDEAQEICSQDVGNSKNKVSLDTAFRNVLQEHTSLHEKILLYEPVWLESMKLILKDHGARCSMNELMNYLDEKCITFRSQQQRGKHRRKQKKESQRASKQKFKDTTDS